jgi:hypothetical protein
VTGIRLRISEDTIVYGHIKLKARTEKVETSLSPTNDLNGSRLDTTDIDVVLPKEPLKTTQKQLLEKYATETAVHEKGEREHEVRVIQLTRTS